LTTVVLASAQTTTYEERPAQLLSNGKLNVTVMDTGAILGSVTIASDPSAPNPLWDPARLARENGRQSNPGGAMGQFVCVDGFGQPSADEKAAGLPGHGEASKLKMTIKRDGPTLVEMQATLPIAQEVFTRTYRLVPGESVIYEDSTLQNLLGLDRPIVWAEHSTVSAPFIEPDNAFIEISGARSQNRPYAVNQNPGAARGGANGGAGRTDRRLVSGADFTWPFAPALGGGTVDMRTFPNSPHYIDHTATLLDPSRETEYAIAFNRARHLVFGWLFRRSDYPFIQNWGSYPSVKELTRGLEFGTQPYDVPRRESFSMGKLFDTPTYRWLPAKGTIESHIIAFYTATPEQMKKVDDVRLEGGSIVIEDKENRQKVVLAASRGINGGGSSK
jgi:hypothetical protein